MKASLPQNKDKLPALSLTRKRELLSLEKRGNSVCCLFVMLAHFLHILCHHRNKFRKFEIKFAFFLLAQKIKFPIVVLIS
jgi:hypothetical protein